MKRRQTYERRAPSVKVSFRRIASARDACVTAQEGGKRRKLRGPATGGWTDRRFFWHVPRGRVPPCDFAVCG